MNNKFHRWMLVLLPVILFTLGAALHFIRGSYTLGSPTVKSWGVDDAYITYRYSWNIAHFNTLSWNESGFRSTEGFTNPLWVLIGLVWTIFGNKDLVYPLSVLTSVLLIFILFAMMVTIVSNRYDSNPGSILGFIGVALVPAIWLHSTSGLESGVFGVGLAILAYLALFPREKPTNTILIIFLSIFIGLLRSDGFIYLGIILCASIIAGSKDWKTLAASLTISIILLFTWRYFTFETLVPNTAVAKLNFPLLERIQVGALFLITSILYSCLIVFLIFGITGLWSESKRIFFAGIFMILAWLGYYLYIGGDGYFERHLVGLYFLMAAFSAPLWRAANKKSRSLLFLVVLISCAVSIVKFEGRFNYLSPKGKDHWILLGKALEVNRERYGVLITFAAGKIPFFAGGDNIDMLGLNDPLLATFQQEAFVPGHSSGDAQTAIEIASEVPPGTYSVFSYLDPYYVKNPEDISMWVSNITPQDTVNFDVTDEQWNAAISTGNIFIWSVISEPNYPD